MTRSLAVALALAGVVAAMPAHAAGLLGQTFNYCTNSVYSGSVTLNPAACDSTVVSTSGTATVADPLVEVNLVGSGTRTVDFGGTTITITYANVGSPSDDLFVFTGFTGLTGLTLASADPLGITTVFNATSIGLQISNPLENGVVVFNVATAAGAVPEPASWAMMLLGFGAVGGAMRAAKRRQALA